MFAKPTLTFPMDSDNRLEREGWGLIGLCTASSPGVSAHGISQSDRYSRDTDSAKIVVKSAHAIVPLPVFPRHRDLRLWDSTVTLGGGESP